MSKIATITVSEVFDFYGPVKPEVFLSNERTDHIKSHHPMDFGEYSSCIADAIENPDFILDDHKNPMTALFIKKVDDNGMNVIVSLAMEGDDNRSFVVTMHKIGLSSLRRYVKKNTIIYSKEEL